MEQSLELAGYKRSIEFYLRALWNKDFNLESLEVAEAIPYAELPASKVVMPASISLENHSLGYWHAAATHIAAHIIFGNEPYDAGELKLMQTSMIDLVEDLRVEILALTKYPGLKKAGLTSIILMNKLRIQQKA